ncbi:MAG: alpha/beta hydrolase [Oscillatoriales cyanobacterium]|nr:MAG: alpha/beta hydrolase [Oscillatoriales cyanobacterium]
MTLDSDWMILIAFALGGLTIAYGIGCAILVKMQTGLVFRPDYEFKQTPADYGLNYREVWIAINSPEERDPNAAAPTEQLHGWWIGETQPQQADRVTIYFHGNRGNISSTLNLERIAAFYQTWGGAFLIADYRGFGRSVSGPPSERKLYEDLDAIWNHITHGEGVAPDRQSICVYGHSLGGAAAIEFARRHPSITALIVDGSFTSIYDVALENPNFRPFPLDRILKHRFESIAKVPTLTMPTLFIHGTADDVVPAFMSEKLYAAAAEPKDLCLLPGVHHEDVLELAPDRFLSTLSHFLDRAQCCVKPS